MNTRARIVTLSVQSQKASAIVPVTQPANGMHQPPGIYVGRAEIGPAGPALRAGSRLVFGQAG